MIQYDNIIIGGGIAGLICGGYLAKAGQKTIIFESKSKTGGRIVSPIDEFEGYRAHIHGITTHPTMGTAGWQEAARELGAKVRLSIVPASATVWWRGKGWAYRYRNAYTTLEGMLELAAVQSPEPFTKTSKQELRKILEEILNADFARLCVDLDTVFLKDWLNEKTKNPQVHHFFLNLSAQVTMTDLEDVKKHFGAGKCFTLIRMWLAREGQFGITSESTLYDELVKPFEDAFISMGGEVKCLSTVDKVMVENDRAAGVVLAGPKGEEGLEYRAKRVIVNCAFPNIPRLFETVPPEVSEAVQELEKIWVYDVAVYSGLNHKITDEPRFVIAQDPTAWTFLLGIQEATVFRPWSAPPGKRLIWTEKIIRKEDYDKKKLKQYLEEMDRITEEVFPGFKEAVEIQRHTVHPLLWHHQYSAYKKIFQESESISGLYFVGDCTAPQYGTGSDGAASTGVIVARKILGAEA